MRTRKELRNSLLFCSKSVTQGSVWFSKQLLLKSIDSYYNSRSHIITETLVLTVCLSENVFSCQDFIFFWSNNVSFHQMCKNRHYLTVSSDVLLALFLVCHPLRKVEAGVLRNSMKLFSDYGNQNVAWESRSWCLLFKIPQYLYRCWRNVWR